MAELAQEWISILPDASKLAAGINAAISKAKVKPLTIPVKFESKQINEAIKKVKPQAIKLPVQLDKSSLNKAISEASKSKLRPIKLPVQINKSEVDRAAAEVSKTKLKPVTLPVKVDPAAATASTQTLAQKLQPLLQQSGQKSGQMYGQSIATGITSATPAVQAAASSAGAKAASSAAAGVSSGGAKTQSMFSRIFNISGHVAGLQSSLAGATSGWNNMSAAADKTHGRMMGAIAQMMRYSLIFTAGGAIFGGLAYGIQTGLQFEDTMHILGATTKASTEELANMQQVARDLGRDMTLPATSANDAASAMLAMTQAGFDMNQAMTAARGTLQLSTATNIEASEAGRIVATTLNAFNRPAEDAGRAVDLMTNIFLKSGAPIHDIGFALQQAATVGSMFGVSMEDTAATLALLAKSGVRGSDAGTLMKTMLAGLTDQGKPAQEAIATLGLQINNANGEFVGMQSLMEQLKGARDRMTEADYNGAAATLFGTDAIRIAAVAATGTKEAWAQMRGEVEETGAAQRVAEARMTGLPGAIEKVKNSFEGLVLVIYDIVKGPLTTFATGLADALSNFTEWITGSSTSLKVWGGILEYIAITVGLCAAAFGVWKIATLAQAAAMWILDAALNANPISLIIIAIAAIIAALVLLYQHNEGFRNFINGLWETIKVVFAKIMEGVAWLVEKWKAAWPTIKIVLQAAWEGIKMYFDLIGEVVMWLWNNIIVPAFHGISNAIETAWHIMEIPFQLFEAAMRILGPIAMALWDQYIKPAWEFIKIAIQVAWDYMSPFFDKMGQAFNTIGEIAKTIGGAIKDAWSGVWDVLKIPLHGLGGFLVGIPDTVLGVKIDFIGDVHDWGRTLQGLRTGGILRGPGTGTSDSILATNQRGVPTARVSNGEGVVPAAPLKTPEGMALFNTLLRMDRGGRMPTGAIIWPPEPIGPKDKRFPGGVPDLKGKRPGQHLPDWGPGTVFGEPAWDWWLKPINPDDILFPELQPPWMQDWLKKHRPPGWGGKRIEGYSLGGMFKNLPGFAGGGITRDVLDQEAEAHGVTLGSGDRNEPGSHHNTPGGARDYNAPGNDPDTLQAWAEYLVANYGASIDQLIWSNPETGEKIGIANGQMVGPGTSQPQYYQNDWDDHTDHVHVGFDPSLTGSGGAGGYGTGVTLGELTASSSQQDVASAIIGEARNQGYSDEEAKAILATALQESGLNPKASGGGGAWKGIFQQDTSYPGREDPNKNISGFFDRLGGPGGDIWKKIFTLQQGQSPDSAGARTAYMGEIQSQTGRAASLMSQVGNMSSTNAGGYYEVDPKKVREAEDKLEDLTRRLETSQQRLKEYNDKRAAGENVKDSTIQGAQDQVDKLTREVDEARADLAEVKKGKFKKGKEGAKEKGKEAGDESGLDGKSLGKMFMEGMFETIGIDGSVFENPFEWPSVKSGMALFNYGMGLAQHAGTDKPGTEPPPILAGLQGQGGGDMGLGALAGVGDMLGIQFPEAQHQGTGNEPGPAVDNSLNVNIENAGMTEQQVAASVTEPQREQARRYNPPNDGS